MNDNSDSTKREYTLTDECDWCHETKLVRELVEPISGEAVLAICEDCDHPNSEFTCGGCGITVHGELDHQAHINETGCTGLPAHLTDNDEFIICPECKGESNTNPDYNCGNCGCVGVIPNPNFTNNTKENNMNINDMKCCAIVKSGDKCDNNANVLVPALYRTVTAYHVDALPAQYKGAGFLRADLAVCGVHKRVLMTGNALSIQALTENNSEFPDKEEMMNKQELPDMTGDPTQVNPEEYGIDSTNGHYIWQAPWSREFTEFQAEVWKHVCDTLHEEEVYDGPTPGDIASDGHPYHFSEVPWNDGFEEAAAEAEEDKKFDLEHTQKEQMKALEGQPFDVVQLGDYGGKVMIERCGHEECRELTAEWLFEASKDSCCGVKNCNHYYVDLCLQHVPATKTVVVPGATPGREQYVHETDVKGRFKEWHGTQGYAKKMIARLQVEGFGGIAMFRSSNGHGFWVYWNVDKSLDEQFTPKEKTTTITWTRRMEKKEGVTCGNCKGTHPTTADVKQCYINAGKITQK